MYTHKSKGPEEKKYLSKLYRFRGKMMPKGRRSKRG